MLSEVTEGMSEHKMHQEQTAVFPVRVKSFIVTKLEWTGFGPEEDQISDN